MRPAPTLLNCHCGVKSVQFTLLVLISHSGLVFFAFSLKIVLFSQPWIVLTRRRITKVFISFSNRYENETCVDNDSYSVIEPGILGKISKVALIISHLILAEARYECSVIFVSH